jgi:hypothetical protein
VAGHRPIFNRGWPFADRHGVGEPRNRPVLLEFPSS